MRLHKSCHAQLSPIHPFSPQVHALTDESCLLIFTIETFMARHFFVLFCVLRCGDHGTCNPSTGLCVCDYDWSGPTCSTNNKCCTSPLNETDPTLCMSTTSGVKGQCINETCYCCPFTFPPNTMTLLPNGDCKCSRTVAKCAAPPCDLAHCGAHTSCTLTTGVCTCLSSWTDYDPVTKSCMTLSTCLHARCVLWCRFGVTSACVKTGTADRVISQE